MVAPDPHGEHKVANEPAGCPGRPRLLEAKPAGRHSRVILRPSHASLIGLCAFYGPGRSGAVRYHPAVVTLSTQGQFLQAKLARHLLILPGQTRSQWLVLPEPKNLL